MRNQDFSIYTLCQLCDYRLDNSIHEPFFLFIHEDVAVEFPRLKDHVAVRVVRIGFRHRIVPADGRAAQAIALLHTRPDSPLGATEETWRLLRAKLDEKSALVERLRQDIRYKARMDVWLYVHVPLTFALLAALTAHIVSIFYM